MRFFRRVRLRRVGKAAMLSAAAAAGGPTAAAAIAGVVPGGPNNNYDGAGPPGLAAPLDHARGAPLEPDAHHAFAPDLTE
ncbi:MAG: hypothetical protein ACKVWR_06900 [Acidimicrobiales bacterium]